MYLYNLEDKHFIKLFISNYDISKIIRQKNWTPYIHINNLYFIYSFNKLCVLKLNNVNTGECICIKGSPFDYNDKSKFFGSTPLIPWNYPNYIGFLHTRAPHYSVPVIFNVVKLNIVFIGDTIIFKNPKNVNPKNNKLVQYPYDLSIKGKKYNFKRRV